MSEKGCYVLLGWLGHSQLLDSNPSNSFLIGFNCMHVHAYSLLYCCLLLSQKFQPQYAAFILAKQPTIAKISGK